MPNGRHLEAPGIYIYIYVLLHCISTYIGHMYIIYVDIKEPEDFQGCFFRISDGVSGVDAAQWVT